VNSPVMLETMVEAIVACHDISTTPIQTYSALDDVSPKRAGKVQLIDASSERFWSSAKESRLEARQFPRIRRSRRIYAKCSTARDMGVL